MQKALPWRDTFPELSGFSDAVWEILDNRAQFIRIARGSVICGPGHPATPLFLLISGAVRVRQLSKGGREIILRRIHAGESCALITACMLTFEGTSAESIAETDIETILIPSDTFDELMVTSKDFRAFVFEACCRRITEVSRIIENMPSQRMDIRVAQELLELEGVNAVLRLTHQQLAGAMGMPHAVLSPVLKEFEGRGWLNLRRGFLELRDVAAIRRLADAKA